MKKPHKSSIRLGDDLDVTLIFWSFHGQLTFPFTISFKVAPTVEVRLRINLKQTDYSIRTCERRMSSNGMSCKRFKVLKYRGDPAVTSLFLQFLHHKWQLHKSGFVTLHLFRHFLWTFQFVANANPTHLGKRRLAIFFGVAKSCGKTEISLSAFLHCWVGTNEVTTAARVTQWRTAYSATSSVARPQGPGSDLFPELHFSLSLHLIPFLSHLSASLSPSSLSCSYWETGACQIALLSQAVASLGRFSAGGSRWIGAHFSCALE